MPRASQTPATGDLFRVPSKGKREPDGWPPDDLVPGSLKDARTMAAECTRCPLYLNATKTVFGEGAARASMMLVGEQPGDQEDLQGHVFVGPAGKVLDRALAEAGIARDTLYVTNGVKHFKNEPRGKKRLHKRPDVREIDICSWWLDLERKFVKPKVVVAMGATAVRAITGKSQSITSLRGQPNQLPEGAMLFVTIHPSAVLRMRGLPDGEAQAEAEYARFVEDLRAAAAAAA
jgi:uracil-DNA glycosylase family protein